MRPAPPRIGRRAVRPLARRPDRLRARRATVAADPRAAANKRVGAPRSRRAAAIRQAAAALAARARAARRARPVGRAGAEPNDDRHGANGGQCAPRVGWPGGGVRDSHDAAAQTAGARRAETLAWCRRPGVLLTEVHRAWVESTPTA